ncbi:MAG: ligand-binding sensor domain-containing protein [Pyrinomonadaceae bacterium]
MLSLAPGAALAERLPIKAYTVADGLAHNEVNKIVRDSRGFLWFCTAEGLSRFDGYRFTTYGTNDGLPHNAVEAFLETRAGELWLGTGAGLVRFNPKGAPTDRIVYADETRSGDSAMFTVIVPEDEDRRARYISVLIEGSDGTVWAGTRKGLYRLERAGGYFRLRYVDLQWPSEMPPVIWDLLEDRHGTLWVAHSGGLIRRRPDGGVAHYTTRDGLPDNQIHDLFEDHRGQLWAGTRGHGFFRFTADQTHAPPSVNFTFAVRDLEQSEWINELFETSDHKLWAATANGLIEFIPDGDDQGRRYRHYTRKNGLSDQGITALNEDMGGNLWLGGEVGAMKLARVGFISYGEQDGLLTVAAIFGDRTGGTCFRAGLSGDERKTVFEGAQPNFPRPLENRHTRYGRFDGRSFTWLKPDVLTPVQLGWVGEGVTLQARNGEWWLGGGLGLYRFPATDNFAQLKHARPIAVYTTKDGLTSPQVFRLFEDSRGNIWVSTIAVQNGLARWDRASETWHDLANTPGLPLPKDDLARAFGEDSAGNLWIGFNGGAARYRDGSFTFITAKDGLPPGGVMNFHTDRNAHLWLASARSGLIRVDDPGAERPVFINYTTAHGLSSDRTEAITEDLSGRIYIGTGRGLDRLDPATGRFKHFTTADGLAPGNVMAAFRDRDGVLWFGTWNGLSRLAPGADDEQSQPPPILITALTVAGKRQSVSALGDTEISLPDLAADSNQLQIDFVALSFAPGEVLRYQYQLEGSDSEWSVPAEQRTVNFANLAPGRYKFSVRAVNSDGAISPQPATVTFTILPPFWQRWWFVMLTLAAICLIVYLLYRYRVARILELANVRTRIASDLHDDIGANLTKISILSEVARQQLGNGDDEKDSPLASIARISRESVASMSDIVWAINPRRDSLRDVIRRMRLHAEETCLPHEIELEFDAPADLDLKLGSETRRSLYLVFKEALNNAVRHSGCWRIRVALSIDRDRLMLELTDNGLGFDAASENDGNGLVSMRRRAEALGGKLEIASSAGNGTTIRLQLPGAQLHRFLPMRG